MKFDFYYNDLQKKIVRILLELGVPANIRGYQYARDAIEMIYNDLELSKNFKRNIYPIISKKYKVNIHSVERNIRHAIEVSATRGNFELLEEIFGYTVDVNKTKPTNSEFLITIADKIKLNDFVEKFETMF